MIGVGANRRIWPFVEPPPISPWILDNLGFTINPGDLAEGWSTYREAHKKLFGVGWLSRYWMGYIYPVIRPKRYAELKRAFEEQRLKMQEKFLAAILKATEGE